MRWPLCKGFCRPALAAPDPVLLHMNVCACACACGWVHADFSTLFKHGKTGQLYLLVTDLGYLGEGEGRGGEGCLGEGEGRAA